MIAALASTEFLPTDTSFSMPDSTLATLMLTGAVLLAWVAFAYLMDEEWLAFGIFAFAGLIFAGIPISMQYAENQDENKANRIENVKTVYDVDDVLLEHWSEENPKAMITKSGKTYEVILSENKETFEPILSTLNNDSFDVEKLRKAK